MSEGSEGTHQIAQNKLSPSGDSNWGSLKYEAGSANHCTVTGIQF